MAPGWYPTPEGPRYWDGYRWAPPPPKPFTELVTTPLLGWLMSGAGALVFVGSFMDWASAFGGLVSKTGVDGGDGWITVLLGAGMIGLGIAIGRKQGLLPLTMIVAVLSACAGALAVYEVSDVHKHSLDVGPGLWVIIVGALAGFCLGIAGAFVRERH